jgi:hypothetical protein
MSWQKYEPEFQRDGSLRDVYIMDTDMKDWQSFIDLVQELNIMTEFSRGPAVEEIPSCIKGAFSGQYDETCSLSIFLDNILLRTHFFVESEIELDLDPRDFRSQEDLDKLVAFMGKIAQRVGKPVLLTPENCPESPIFVVQPGGLGQI